MPHTRADNKLSLRPDLRLGESGTSVGKVAPRHTCLERVACHNIGSDIIHLS